MITTVVTSSGKIHALEEHPRRRTLCGKPSTVGTMFTMRRSPADDAYVTCKTCDRKLKAGETLSAKTVDEQILKARLAQPMAGKGMSWSC